MLHEMFSVSSPECIKIVGSWGSGLDLDEESYMVQQHIFDESLHCPAQKFLMNLNIFHVGPTIIGLREV